MQIQREKLSNQSLKSQSYPFINKISTTTIGGSNLLFIDLMTQLTLMDNSCIAGPTKNTTAMLIYTTSRLLFSKKQIVLKLDIIYSTQMYYVLQAPRNIHHEVTHLQYKLPLVFIYCNHVDVQIHHPFGMPLGNQCLKSQSSIAFINKISTTPVRGYNLLCINLKNQLTFMDKSYRWPN